MKKSPLFYLLVLLLLSCAEEKKENEPIVIEKETLAEPIELKFQNPLKEFSKIERQKFELNLVEDSIIKGKKGTVIYFERKYFNVTSSTPITLTLEEYYDFNELLFHQISTETNDGKLLETSGVINVEVVTDAGNEIKLKESKTIQVTFPDNRIINNDIYYGERDEKAIMKWEKDTSLVDTIILNYSYQKTYGVDLYMNIKVPRDSLDYYLELNESFAIPDIAGNMTNNTPNYSPIIDPTKINLQKLNWINIDRLVEPDKYQNVILENKELLNHYVIFVLYEEINSFMNYNIYKTEDEIVLENIPIKGKTYLLIVKQNSENELLAQKIILSETDRYLLNLEKKSVGKLNQMITGKSARDSSGNPAMQR
jgi:hypothetical protein